MNTEKTPEHLGDAVRSEIRSMLAAAYPRITEEIARIAPIAASPYLNRTDAAAWAGCSLSKIATLTRKGKLKPKYLGGQPLYAKAQIEDLMRADTVLKRRRRAAEALQQTQHNSKGQRPATF